MFRLILCTALAGAWACSAWAQADQATRHPHGPFHAYPQEIVDAMLARKLAEKEAFYKTALPGAYSFVAHNQLWQASDKLIVAFYGGNYATWRSIAEIANAWTKEANISFDFGLDEKKKTARTWDPNNPSSVSAHVRIRLDVDDNSVRYSAVGREAFLPEYASGSMVLGGIAIAYPLWSKEDRADILHEFGHVLGFLHEQQRPECLADLRLTTGPHGEPSLYDIYQEMYHWPPDQTRRNFELAATYSPQGSNHPDKKSLFMYPTEPEVLPATLKGKNGPCYVGSKNLVLSPIDKQRARKDYPFGADNQITNLASGNIGTIKQLLASAGPLAASPLISQRLDSIEKALRPQVYIQVASEEQRELGRVLQKELQANGFIAPGVENIAKKATAPKEIQVRYFTARDERNARAVVDALQDTTVPPMEIQTVLIPRRSLRKQPIEVWLPKSM